MEIKRGDVIHTEYGRFKYLVMVDSYNGQELDLTYLYRCWEDGTDDPYGSSDDSLYIGTGQKRIDRQATQKEKELLLACLSKNVNEHMRRYEKYHKKPSPIFEILLNNVLK